MCTRSKVMEEPCIVTLVPPLIPQKYIFGGMEKRAYKVDEFLIKSDKIKYDIFILGKDPKYPIAGSRPLGFGYIRRIGFKNLKYTAYLCFHPEKLARIFNKYDLIHLHFPVGVPAILILKRYVKKPIVVTHHLTPAKIKGKEFEDLVWNIWDYALRIMTSKMFRDYDKIIFSTYSHLDFLKYIKPDYRKKAIVIPNGVDTKYFNPFDKNKEELKEKYNVKRVYLYFGRIAPEKGVFGLIDAWKKFKHKKESVLLLIGPYMGDKNLYTLRKHNIIYLGPIVDEKKLAYYVKNADVIVLPHKLKGLSLTILEALATENTIVLPKIVFTDFMKRYKQLFYLIEDFSEKNILEALEETFYKDHLAKGGYEIVKKNHSWEAIANKYIEVFCSLL